MRLRKIVVERVTVVKFRVDNRGSNGTGCFRIKVRTDTAELTNMRIASRGKNCSNFIGLLRPLGIQVDCLRRGHRQCE